MSAEAVTLAPARSAVAGVPVSTRGQTGCDLKRRLVDLGRRRANLDPGGDQDDLETGR